MGGSTVNYGIFIKKNCFGDVILMNSIKIFVVCISNVGGLRADSGADWYTTIIARIEG